MALPELTYPNYDKPKLVQEEVETIADLHQKWLEAKPGGYRADFSRQDLTGCDLSGLNFSGACFAYANMNGVISHRTNFSGAFFHATDLKAADLAFGNFSYANFTGAILTNANLFRTRLAGTLGNGKEIKTVAIGGFPCVYTSDFIQFACQRHSIDVWVDVTDAMLEKMDKNAQIFYKNHYNTLKDLVTLSAPAVSTKHENTTTS